MSYDPSLRFNAAQNMFATNASVLSTDWIALNKAMDLGAVKPAELEITVDTTGSGVGTIRFELGLVDDAGANFTPVDSTPPLTPSTLVAPTAAGGQTGTLAVKGTRIVLRMSPEQVIPGSTLRNLRYRSVCVGVVDAGAFTGQMVDRAMTRAPDQAYAAGH